MDMTTLRPAWLRRAPADAEAHAAQLFGWLVAADAWLDAASVGSRFDIGASGRARLRDAYRVPVPPRPDRFAPHASAATWVAAVRRPPGELVWASLFVAGLWAGRRHEVDDAPVGHRLAVAACVSAWVGWAHLQLCRRTSGTRGLLRATHVGAASGALPP